MFSRITALFFFMVANIILLANICIPHHHHYTEICIVESHCQTDGDPDEHESDGHDHDSSNSSEYCVLHQVYIVPNNHLIQDYKEMVCANYHSHSEGFQTDTSYKGLQCPLVKANGPPIVLSAKYSSVISTSIGLRAPPPTV